MNQFPNEIIVDIFNRLAFTDKLQCALTCRDWYTMISSTVLYSKICFKNPQCDIQTKSRIKYLYNQGLGHQILDLNIKGLTIHWHYLSFVLISSHCKWMIGYLVNGYLLIGYLLIGMIAIIRVWPKYGKSLRLSRKAVLNTY